ncbi:MAG TPA: DnaJ domain-containing protein [Candidatus Limnocylindrales bacterium]|nr:DnaJ domain-containing protein [Candidatus Limnocylindrales bacterium]
MIVDPRRTIYKVLMVDQEADAEIIHAVYRKLARRYHPDADPSAEAARRMREINEAYAIARDPIQRAAYDHELSLRRDRRATDRILKRPGDVPLGPAGMPPGPPEGSVLEFGRYAGWTLGQVKRSDPDFLEWLMRVPAGRQYRTEITELLGRRA